MSEWQPLSIRGSESASEYESLVDGVPDWLNASVERWISRCTEYRDDLVGTAERVLRKPLVSAGAPSATFLHYWAHSFDSQRLELVDFLLHDLELRCKAAQARYNDDAAKKALMPAIELDRMLTEAGSVWRVVLKPNWALERRVNDASRAQVALAMSPASDAARKISSAWHACFGQDPNYDHAYRDAVLAVEAVALPLLIPNDGQGTLGKAITHLSDTVAGWTVAALDDPRQASAETLVAMLRSLWHNQERHAQPDGTVGAVSRQEAETAVSLAVTLVHWFSAGLIQRIADSRKN